MRKILACFSDTHAGSVYGLMNPDTELAQDPESGLTQTHKIQLTPIQEYLWHLYIENIEKIKEIAGDSEIILLVNGDITHGNYFQDEWVSPFASDQITIARANMEPWLHITNVKTIIMSKGTRAHVFGGGSAEKIIAQLISAKYEGINITAAYHSDIELLEDNFSIDQAHKGPSTGSRDWLKGNVAQLYLKDQMIWFLKNNRKPPQLFTRAHFHEYVRVIQVLRWGEQEYESMLVVTPALCGVGEWTIDRTRSKVSQNLGMIAFEIENGKIRETYPMIEDLELRTKIVI